MELLVRNQYVVDEFLKNFRAAYNKHFEGKNFLKKSGDRWSVVVSFSKIYFPKKDMFLGYVDLVVSLETEILKECLYREKNKEKVKNLKDNEGGFLVARFCAQEAENDPEIVEEVNKLKKEFIEYVEKMQKNTY